MLPELLWIELATHLSHLWAGVTRAVKRFPGVPLQLVDAGIGVAIATWRSRDALAAAVTELNAELRRSEQG